MFKGACLNLEASVPLPEYSYLIRLPNSIIDVNVELINTQYESLSFEENKLIDSRFIQNRINIKTEIKQARKQKYAILKLIPLKTSISDGAVLKLTHFSLNIQSKFGQKSPRTPIKQYPSNSILASGEWFKIAIPEDGIYKITYDFLKNLGIDIHSVTPRSINIYGNSLGMLPEDNNIPRPSDLLINNIFISGEDDGEFNKNDYILFYAKGPHSWKFNSSSSAFYHQKNLYTNYSHYFIGIGTNEAKRIKTAPIISEPTTHEVTTFDDYKYHEKDLSNFIKSGKEWFGELFDIETSRNFNFEFDNIDKNSLVKVKLSLLGRTISSDTVFSSFVSKISSTGVSTETKIQSFTPGHRIPFGRLVSQELIFNPKNDQISLNIEFNKYNPTSKGWLNYIEVNVGRHLIMSGSQLRFRNKSVVGKNNISQFRITNAIDVSEIWDVTNPAK